MLRFFKGKVDIDTNIMKVPVLNMEPTLDLPNERSIKNTFNSPVPAEIFVCPVAVPKVTLGAERSMFTMGALAEK